jgi:feruloyl-CoA synthase
MYQAGQAASAAVQAIEPQRRPIFAPARVEAENLPGGGMILRAPVPLDPYPRCVGAMVERWAGIDPDRLFLAERDGVGGWRRVTYGEAWRAARAIGQAVLDRGLSAERPVLILAENGIDHALLMLGAMQVGVPVAPVSTAYARLSQDFSKLKYIAGLLRPGLVYVGDPTRYAPALAAVDFGGAELVATQKADGFTPFASLMAATPGAAADRAYADVGPETIAKILFTSGSTDLPKGVINTQRMLCANQQMIAQVWPFLAERPPVIVDWLPWNHTFGANHNFNMVAYHGGTLHTDEGKPAPGLIDRTLANLREISPSVYFNVPRGYAMLIDHLERDDALRAKFFARLELLFYAGAGLPQSLWTRLDALAREARGHPLPVISSWGLTETAPMVTTVHFPVDRAGIIGIPAPGVALKLVPSGDKLEMRVRGPNVTPGYWRRGDLTAAAFDEDGWYRTGDAGVLVDPQQPARGLAFDGRIAENFKLSSGTWVNVGALRTVVIAAASPAIEDAVIAGHDHDEIGLLAFPSLAGCRSLCTHLGNNAAASQLVGDEAVRERIREGLRRHNDANPGSSMRIARILLMTEPPSIDANEITDKGYINQRAVLTNRAALVETLYADPPTPDVIVIEAP